MKVWKRGAHPDSAFSRSSEVGLETKVTSINIMNSTESITVREREKKTLLFLRLDSFLPPQFKLSQWNNPQPSSPHSNLAQCTPTLRACPQSASSLHPAVRGIAVVLSHSDAIVGEQPGQLCTQEALDRVYWFIRSSKVPEFDFPVAPCRD